MIKIINRSKIKFEQYVDLKNKSAIKSYTERFKLVDKFLYCFSWFGNGVSIFLAFFFLQALFLSSFNNVGSSMVISIGIIFFLTLFELLKRFVFSMFSNNIIISGFNIFKKNMISFILGVAVLLVGSFYFSLNGAEKFIDNQRVFQEQTEHNITSKVDSINNFYFNEYIKPLKDENKIYVNQNTNYALEASKSGYKSKYTDLISSTNLKIDKNNDMIYNYESKRDIVISEFKTKQEDKLSNNINDNKSNIFAFILISCLIELVIMLGVYYDNYYTHKVILEYEETVINTIGFKKWYTYNQILEIIFINAKLIGDTIPSTNNILEVLDINEIVISKGEFDKFVKLLYHLDILKLESSRRIVTKLETESKQILRDHFKIS